MWRNSLLQAQDFLDKGNRGAADEKKEEDKEYVKEIKGSIDSSTP